MLHVIRPFPTSTGRTKCVDLKWKCSKIAKPIPFFIRKKCSALETQMKSFDIWNTKTKHPEYQKDLKYKEESASTTQSQAQLLNSFSTLCLHQKQLSMSTDTKTRMPNFKVSVRTIEIFLNELNIKKCRGPNNLPPIFYKAKKNKFVERQTSCSKFQTYPETTLVLFDSGRSTSVKKGHSETRWKLPTQISPLHFLKVHVSTAIQPLQKLSVEESTRFC